MNIRSIKLFGLSALVLTLLIGTSSIQAQQIISDNKVDSGSAANSGALKDNKAAKKTVKTDSPAAPAAGGYDWTGAYIGAHAGYGWGKADTDFNPLPSAATFINLAPTTLQLRPRGFNGGVQGGYNWQFGHLVVGGETDFTWSDMRRTRTVTPITQNNGTPFPGAGFITTTQKTEWFGTLRPRLGYAAGKLLIYGTAGLAYGNVRSSANVDFRPFGTVQYPAFLSKTTAGWTAGGGMEIGITKHLSIKSEYLYYDLGKINTVASASPALPPFQVGYTWEAKAHTWNAGFNFRF
jgi:outer membrane immunogenic protein